MLLLLVWQLRSRDDDAAVCRYGLEDTEDDTAVTACVGGIRLRSFTCISDYRLLPPYRNIIHAIGDGHKWPFMTERGPVDKTDHDGDNTKLLTSSLD